MMGNLFGAVQILVIAALLASVLADSEEGTCDLCSSTATSHIHKLHGTKTTYKTALSHIIQSKNTTIPPTCEPIMMYLFKRHAIRYPDGEDIPEMEQILERIKSQALTAYANGKSGLCPKDIENLRKWKINMKPEDDNLITTTGTQETAEIGVLLVIECLVSL